MVSPHSVPPPITIDSSIQITKHDDPHKHRRRFIGPMPERVVTQLDTPTDAAGGGWGRLFARSPPGGGDADDAGVRAAIREYSLHFFLGHGGRTEDWGEAQARSVREEMYARWQQSEWARARAAQKAASAAARQQWVGASFDVGVFLGVDVLDAARSVHTPTTHGAGSAVGSAARFRTAPSTAATAADTFVTARTPGDADSAVLDAVSERRALSRTSFPFPDGDLRRPDSTNSATPLLETPSPPPDHGYGALDARRAVPSDRRPRPRTEASAQGGSSSQYLDVPKPTKNKGKTVHYPEVQTPHEEPAPPGEVLARTGSEMEETSEGAAQQAIAEVQVPAEQGDVVMRDRMLVQISCTGATSLPPGYDEAKARVTPHEQYYRLSEYMVVWRKKRIELYKNYSTPGREWFTGHKQLAFIIPLHSTTKLSLYSFTDFTFCLTCPHMPLRAGSQLKGRWILYGGSKGTNIFIFNLKSRTRAADWYWKLWKQLGGELPPFVELRCPRLDTRLRIDIPPGASTDFTKAYEIFTPPNTVELCKQVLNTVEDYDAVIGKALEEGSTLQLAWRVDTRLDWIWQNEDVMGMPRDWAVLYGLAIKQAGKSAHLELRLEEHRPTRVHLKDGTRLDEPPGIEGYLDRIRPNSQLKQSLYVSTHDGYIFFINPTAANPPAPPGPPPDVSDPDALLSAEAVRGARQVLAANGICDLRSIVAVRRAFQVIPRQTEEVSFRDTPPWEDTPEFWAAVEHYEEDYRDAGGAEGLSKAADATQMRVRRSFEVVLKSGRVLRFETQSCQFALEWINRLRQLVSYWKKRHQVDARNEMDIMHAATGRPRITPHKHVDTDRDEVPEAPPDPEASSPELSWFYDWCLLHGCRPISKCGRVFGRRGLRGQYHHMQLILVSGHLVEYGITSTSLHYRRRGVVHLLDAYVYSGYLAAQHLPEGQYNADNPPLPRRYQDGLESDELEEDTLFMVWWCSVPVKTPENSIPPLAGKRKISVYRTRSKLERDSWVWAIKSEVEKSARAMKEREAKLRETGGLVQA